MARRAHVRALGRSPASIRSYERTTASQALADVSPRSSRSRSARANQPRTGAMRAVSKSRCIATRTAAPAAASVSPASAQRVRPLPRLDGHVEMPRRVRDLAEDR